MSESIREMIRKLDFFCLNTKHVITESTNKTLSFDENSEKYDNSSVQTASTSEETQTEEYLEILKLRHINLAR